MRAETGDAKEKAEKTADIMLRSTSKLSKWLVITRKPVSDVGCGTKAHRHENSTIMNTQIKYLNESKEL